MKLTHLTQLIHSFFSHATTDNNQALYQSIIEQNANAVHSLLTTMPSWEINQVNIQQAKSNQVNYKIKYTLFFHACSLLSEHFFDEKTKSCQHIVKTFLNCDKVNFNWQDERGNVGLFKLVNQKLYEPLREMVDSPRVNLHIKNKERENILHLLAHLTYHPSDEDSLSLFKHLIDKGVDYHLKNKKGQNVLNIAIGARQINLVEFLLTTDIEKNYTPLTMYEAIWADLNIQTNMAKLLIDNGYDFNLFLTYLHSGEESVKYDFPLMHSDFFNKVKELTQYVHIKQEKSGLENILEKSDTPIPLVKAQRRKI